MKKISVLGFLLCSLFLTGCGERVSIQPGEVGKQLNTKGLEDEIRRPGTFRLDQCWLTSCPRLVRLQVQKSTMEFTVNKLLLPKSNVDLSNVQVGIQFRVKENEESINRIYEEVRPVAASSVRSEGGLSGDSVLLITTDMLYDTYIARKAPDAVIAALREYTVEETLTKTPEIAKYAKDKANEMLKDTPIEITELGFPNGAGEPPQEVLEAKRKFFVVEEETARSIKKYQAAIEIEKARQAVQRTRVSNDLENAITAGIPFGLYVLLKNMERFAEEGVPLGYVPLQAFTGNESCTQSF